LYLAWETAKTLSTPDVFALNLKARRVISGRSSAAAVSDRHGFVLHE